MILYGVITVLIIAIDQIIKCIVSNNLNYGDNIIIIPNILSATYAENRGAAFGILQNNQVLFIIVGIFIVLIFAYIIFVKNISNRVFLVSAVLIIGGGVGNLIDRVLRGYVIDYLQLSFFAPICNLADYCITFGTVLLMVYLLFCMDSDSEAIMNKEKEK